MTDAADMSKMGPIKQVVLVACLIYVARVRGRDEPATMFCKRMATIHKQAKVRFEVLRESARADAERLVDVLGDVLAAVRDALGPSDEETESGQADEPAEVAQRAGTAVLVTLGAAGGVAELSATHEQVASFHGDNCLPFLERHCRRNRAALFGLLDTLQLIRTTADTTVVDAVRFLRANRHRTREHIPDHLDGEPVDLSFASEAWRKIRRDRRRSTRLVRRLFEACVFSYLTAELRSGDIAVAGSESYANLHEQLLTW